MMKTQRLLFPILFLLPMLCYTSCGEQTASKEDTIDFKNAFIVDVRTPEEFKEGTFEGAINIPLSTVEENMDKFKGKEQIVIFCRTGNRSGQAIKILEDHGISNLFNGINQEHLEALQKEKK